MQTRPVLNSSLMNFLSISKANVVPPLSDDIQLSVPEYKEKLYELIHEYKTSSKRHHQQQQQILLQQQRQ